MYIWSVGVTYFLWPSKIFIFSFQKLFFGFYFYSPWLWYHISIIMVIFHIHIYTSYLFFSVSPENSLTGCPDVTYFFLLLLLLLSPLVFFSEHLLRTQTCFATFSSFFCKVSLSKAALKACVLAIWYHWNIIDTLVTPVWCQTSAFSRGYTSFCCFLLLKIEEEVGREKMLTKSQEYP